MAQPNIQPHDGNELKKFEDLIRTKSDLPQNIGKKIYFVSCSLQ